MLSNACFLAKFRFDTAENEPAKNLKKTLIFFQLAARPSGAACWGDPAVSKFCKKSTEALGVKYKIP